jgi:protein phosphatase
MTRPDLSSYALEPGHRFLFCTDGVTNLLSDEELGRFAAGPGDLRDILRELIASVLSRGAVDNATAVLLAWD